MKKWMKATVILGSSLCLAGAVLGLCGWAGGGVSYAERYDLNAMDGSALRSETMEVKKKTKLEDFSELQADLQFGDFKILPSGDTSCYISWRLPARKGKQAAEYENKDGVLTIRETKAASSYVHVDISFLGEALSGDEDPDYGIVLYVPEEKKLNRLQVESEYGDLELCGIQVMEGTIKSEDGDIKIQDCDMRNTELKNAYGDVEVKNGSWQDGTIALSDGDLELKHTKLSGSVEGKNELGDMSLELSITELRQLELNLQTELGEIDLPGEMRNQISGEGSEQSVQYTPEHADGRIHFRAEDGDITIEND